MVKTLLVCMAWSLYLFISFSFQLRFAFLRQFTPQCEGVLQVLLIMQYIKETEHVLYVKN